MDGPRGGSITLGHLRFEPYTGPISVEKLNPLSLESGEDLRQGLLARGGGAALEIGNRLFGDFGMPDQLLLRPVEEGAGRRGIARG